MSARISSLPVVVSANIADTDILPIVTGIASNTGVTKRIAVSELRLKLGTTPPAGGRTVTNIATYLQNNSVFNVKDFGAFGDGVTDDTTAIQNAINAAYPTKATVLFPAATYKITTGLTLYMGSQLKGETSYQMVAGYGIDPKATRINFAPGSVQDLFTFSAVGRGGGLAFHISIQGFYISGNGANSRYGIHADGVIYSHFEDIGFEGFQYAVRCNGTINNRFVNMYTTGSVACVVYAGGNETTDVWDQVTFYGPAAGGGSPIGVQFLGSSIAIRFTNCLWEQINTYGMDIARECQNIIVENGYAEDVPFANNANASMFRVGAAGAALIVENQLTVIGGKYAGRNAGTVGNFLDCDYVNGIQLIGVNHSRFTNIIRTTVNTRANSIVVSGGVGISWTTYATDFTKVAGTYPSGVVNAGAQIQHMIVGNVTANSGTASGLWASATAAVKSAVASLLTLGNTSAAALNNKARIIFQNNYTNWGVSDDAYIDSRAEEALNFRARVDISTADGTGANPAVRFSIRGAGQVELANLGAAPANLVDGQLWYDGTNIRFRTGGVSKTVTVT